MDAGVWVCHRHLPQGSRHKRRILVATVAQSTSVALAVAVAVAVAVAGGGCSAAVAALLLTESSLKNC